MNLNNKMTRKLILVVSLSITILLFFIGIVNIINTGLQIPISVTVVMFAIGFVIGTILSENRNGVYPWTLIGGLIIAIIATVIITCVFSGIMFSVTGGIFELDINRLIYLFSFCMIFSVISLNIAYNIPYKKELSDQDLEYYEELNQPRDD